MSRLLSTGSHCPREAICLAHVEFDLASSKSLYSQTPSRRGNTPYPRRRSASAVIWYHRENPAAEALKKRFKALKAANGDD
jgi:hypothetical protein